MLNDYLSRTRIKQIKKQIEEKKAKPKQTNKGVFAKYTKDTTKDIKKKLHYEKQATKKLKPKTQPKPAKKTKQPSQPPKKTPTKKTTPKQPPKKTKPQTPEKKEIPPAVKKVTTIGTLPSKKVIEKAFKTTQPTKGVFAKETTPPKTLTPTQQALQKKIESKLEQKTEKPTSKKEAAPPTPPPIEKPKPSIPKKEILPPLTPPVIKPPSPPSVSTKQTTPMIPEKALKTKLGQLEQKTVKAKPEELKEKPGIELTKQEVVKTLAEKEKEISKQVKQMETQYKATLTVLPIQKALEQTQVQGAIKSVNKQIEKVKSYGPSTKFTVNGKEMSYNEVMNMLQKQKETLQKQAKQIPEKYKEYQTSLTKGLAPSYYEAKKALSKVKEQKKEVESLPEDVYKFVKKKEGEIEIKPLSYTEQFMKKYGSNPELAKAKLTAAAFVESPLAVGSIARIAAKVLTGDKTYDKELMERLSKTALSLDKALKKGPIEYTKTLATSPAMTYGVYIPGAAIATAGAAGAGIGALSRVAPTAGSIAKVGIAIPTVATTGMAGAEIGKKIISGKVGEAATEAFAFGVGAAGAAKAFKAGEKFGFKKADVYWATKYPAKTKITITETQKIISPKTKEVIGVKFKGFQKSTQKISIGQTAKTKTYFEGIQSAKGVSITQAKGGTTIVKKSPITGKFKGVEKLPVKGMGKTIPSEELVISLKKEPVISVGTKGTTKIQGVTVKGENIPGFKPKIEMGLKPAEKVGLTKEMFKGGKGTKYGYTEAVGKIGTGKKTVLTKGISVSSVSKPKTTLYAPKGTAKVAKVSEIETISKIVGKPVKGKPSYPTTVIEKGTIYDKSVKPTELKDIFKISKGISSPVGGGAFTKLKLDVVGLTKAVSTPKFVPKPPISVPVIPIPMLTTKTKNKTITTSPLPKSVLTATLPSVLSITKVKPKQTGRTQLMPIIPKTSTMLKSSTKTTIKPIIEPGYVSTIVKKAKSELEETTIIPKQIPVQIQTEEKKEDLVIKPIQTEVLEPEQEERKITTHIVKIKPMKRLRPVNLTVSKPLTTTTKPPAYTPPMIPSLPLEKKKKKKKKKPLIHVYKPSKTMYAWRRFKLPEFFFGTKSKR